MRRTVGTLSMAFTLLASICLAVGYLHDRQAALALALLVLGLLWVLAQWRGWDWASGLGLAATAGVAAAGAWLGLPPGWMIAAAVAALLAWDLAGFRRRLALAAPTDDLPALTHRHLASAGLVAGIGVLLAAAATLVELRFPLGWTMLLALAAALGTARLVGWLRA